MAFTDDRLRDELRRLPLPDVAEHDELQQVTARAERRRRALRLRAGGVLVALLAVVAGSAVVVQTDRTTVVTAEPGWDRLGEQRIDESATIAWVKGKLIVFGGKRGDRTLNEGRAFDPATGKWERIPDAPFEHALFSSRKVETPQGLIVMGEQCGRILTENSADHTCTGQGIGVALYQPDSRHWKLLPPPAEFSARCGESAALPSGEGWSGALLFADCNDVWLVHLPEGRWERTPTPPMRARALCFADDGMVAAQWAIGGDLPIDARSGLANRSPTGFALEARVFDTATRTWSPVVRGPVAAQPDLATALCAGESMVVLAGEEGNEAQPPRLTRADRFDLSTRRWAPAALPPTDMVHGTGVWTGTETHVTNGTLTLYAYDPKLDRWRRVGTTPRHLWAWAGDRYVTLSRGRLSTWVPG